jgi:hypothetical protein
MTENPQIIERIDLLPLEEQLAQFELRHAENKVVEEYLRGMYNTYRATREEPLGALDRIRYGMKRPETTPRYSDIALLYTSVNPYDVENLIVEVYTSHAKNVADIYLALNRELDFFAADSAALTPQQGKKNCNRTSDKPVSATYIADRARTKLLIASENLYHHHLMLLAPFANQVLEHLGDVPYVGDQSSSLTPRALQYKQAVLSLKDTFTAIADMPGRRLWLDLPEFEDTAQKLRTHSTQAEHSLIYFGDQA